MEEEEEEDDGGIGEDGEESNDGSGEGNEAYKGDDTEVRLAHLSRTRSDRLHLYTHPPLVFSSRHVNPLLFPAQLNFSTLILAESYVCVIRCCRLSVLNSLVYIFLGLSCTSSVWDESMSPQRHSAVTCNLLQ